MKKTIANVLYDTDSSELIHKYTSGDFGDAAGYEESLYKTECGKYFLYVNGGPDSIYPGEKIKRISPAKADEWLTERNK